MKPTERWASDLHRYVQTPKITAYIEEVLAVGQKHGFSITHEDGHGAFEITDHDPFSDQHLAAAHVARGTKAQ